MVSLNLPAARSFYYAYPPYLQPTPSVGTGARVAGSAALGSRPKFGGIVRIYNFYKQHQGTDAFLNDFVLATYGVRK